MKKYTIITDTSSDLDIEYYEKNNVAYVPFSVSFNNKDYFKELDDDFTLPVFYEMLINNSATPQTSLPSVGDYCDLFLKAAEENVDVLCLCLSSDLSGSYQSAKTAKSIILGDYPSTSISVIDSRQASVTQGYLLKKAVENRNNGLNLKDNCKSIKNTIPKLNIIFSVDSLEHLTKGGRISHFSSTIGTFLDVKPILSFKDGIISPLQKVRKLKKAKDFICNVIKDEYEKSSDVQFILVYSGYESYALDIKDCVENTLNLNIELPISRIGVTISSHSGPTTFGVAMIRN